MSPEAFPSRTTAEASLLVLTSATIVGLWYKSSQLASLDPSLFHYYPVSRWIFPVVVTSLLFFFLWLSWGLFTRLLFPQYRTDTSLLFDAATFPFLTPLALDGSRPLYLGLFVAVKALHIFVLIRRYPGAIRKFGKTHAQPLSALLVIVIAQTLGNGVLGPRGWGDPLVSLSKHESKVLPLTSGLYRADYVGAKRFDLSGFDSSYWGASTPTPTSYHSDVLALSAMLLDLPAIDLVTFYRSLQILTFLLEIAGCFGFYCLARRAWGLSHATALIGGVLYGLGNYFFSVLATYYFPGFISVYLVLPFALWLACESAVRGSKLAALASGAVMALPFLWLSPHPDAVIHGLFFFSCYFVFWLVRYRRGPVPLLLAGLGFTLASARFTFPIFAQVWAKDAVYFGHDEVLHQTLGMSLEQIWPFLRGSGALMLFAAWEWRSCRKKPDVVFLFAFFSLLALAVLSGAGGWFDRLFRVRGRPLYYFNLYRVSLYLCWSALALGLFGIDSFLRARPTRFVAIVSGLVAVVLVCYRPEAAWLSFRAAGLFTVVTIALWAYQTPGHLANKVAVGTVLGLILLYSSSHDWENPAQSYNPNGCASYLSKQGLSAANASLGFLDPGSVRFLKRQPDDKQAASFRCLFTQVETKQRAHYLPRLAYNDIAMLRPLPLFSRILFATRDFATMGLAGTFSVVNTSMSTDTRFMFPYPPLGALYLIPGEKYRVTGRYDSPTPWTPGLEPLKTGRSLYQLAGVDDYVVSREAFATLGPQSGLSPVPFHAEKALEPPYLLLHDRGSRGIAYMAKTVSAIPPEPGLFRQLHPPFRDVSDYREFSNLVDDKLDRLRRLGPGETLLEANDESPWDQGQVNIVGMGGNKASFTTHCPGEKCLLVVNLAATQGWSVFIDDKRVTWSRANYAFLGIPVPGGQHSVWIEHARAADYLGTLITGSFYLLLLILSWPFFCIL